MEAKHERNDQSNGKSCKKAYSCNTCWMAKAVRRGKAGDTGCGMTLLSRLPKPAPEPEETTTEGE